MDFCCDPKLRTAFETLRQRLCEGPVFTLLEVVQDYVVHCDASIMTFWVVIMQQGRVIAYDLAPPSLWGSL